MQVNKIDPPTIKLVQGFWLDSVSNLSITFHFLISVHCLPEVRGPEHTGWRGSDSDIQGAVVLSSVGWGLRGPA